MNDIYGYNMKHFLKRMTLLAVLAVMTVLNGQAQETSQTEKAVDGIVKKYENIQGVESIKVAKGSGLELVKKMFVKQFGKDFMKGVSSITIIGYSEASPETCQSLHKDFDLFMSLLEEFHVGKEEAFADNDYIRSFTSVSDSGTLSDFVIAVENEDSKMLMYMAGDIKVE